HLQPALAVALAQVIAERRFRDIPAPPAHAVLDGLTLHELVACAISGKERVERRSAGARQTDGVCAESPPRRPVRVTMGSGIICVPLEPPSQGGRQKRGGQLPPESCV